jgi:hypothetical protein
MQDSKAALKKRQAMLNAQIKMKIQLYEQDFTVQEVVNYQVSSGFQMN